MSLRGVVAVRENDGIYDVFCAGPLTLSIPEKHANTIMGTDLSLDEKTFNSLYILVTRENEALTLEQLTTDIWDGDTDTALPALKNLIKQVNDAGQGFMQIEYNENTGFIFRTRWINRLPTDKDILYHSKEMKKVDNEKKIRIY